MPSALPLSGPSADYACTAISFPALLPFPFSARQTDKRLNLFTGGHYAAHNLSSALDRERLDSDAHVRMSVWSAPGMSKPGFEEAVQNLSKGDDVRRYSKGDWLGLSWTNHWVRVELTIPTHYAESGEPVICEISDGW